MKKRLLSVLLSLGLVVGLLAGCGSKDTEQGNGEPEVLKFYHAYYHEEEAWPAAAVMRDIYQKFADEHADGPCTFEAIAVEDVLGVATNEIAGGSFPNMVDFAGNEVPAAAIAQELVYDMKDFVDSEGIESKVGINYTMNMKDGKLYTIHDQLTTLGLWYNVDAYKAANAATPDTWNSYEDMAAAMTALTGTDTYAYSAGQGSIRLFNAYIGLLNKEYAESALTKDIIYSDEFAKAFKTVAAMDQANGSANTSDNVGNFSGDFNSGKCATFLNGVWGAGGFQGIEFEVQPGVYPGNVSLSAPGGGLTIASGLSEAQTELALEFVKYMTSDEVQERIFLEINANPCNTDLDLNALAEGSDNDTVKLLAKACSMANEADVIVNTINYVWGADVQTAIINKLIECSVAGTDIDAKLGELQQELAALIS